MIRYSYAMFDHCMYFNTAALARQLERNWTEAYKPFGLTAPQGFLLRAVLRRPGILQGQLAAELAIARPTATRALDGLVAKKLITRQPSNSDGREIEVHPTVRAVALQVPLDKASAAITTRIKRVIGEVPFADLVASVREVRSALK
ncbi:MAG TPA: MarR family transcriptional regulator [Gallionella sp.]|nr:MarR family transcriptional regulator [Gallionella sp.]